MWSYIDVKSRLETEIFSYNLVKEDKKGKMWTYLHNSAIRKTLQADISF